MDSLQLHLTIDSLSNSLTHSYSTDKLLKDRSFLPYVGCHTEANTITRDTSCNWCIERLTSQEFVAVSMVTTERVHLQLQVSMPVALDYHYFSQHLQNGVSIIQQQRTTGHYRNGQRSGAWQFQLHNIIINCHYDKDRLHGASTTSYCQIDRQLVDNWHQGQLHGQQLTYDRGRLTNGSYYCHGRLISSQDLTAVNNQTVTA